jgi:hypothetical protein
VGEAVRLAVPLLILLSCGGRCAPTPKASGVSGCGWRSWGCYMLNFGKKYRENTLCNLSSCFVLLALNKPDNKFEKSNLCNLTFTPTLP